LIDKLDLRIPGAVPFTPQFSDVYAATSRDEKRWRKSNHYVRVASFEDCGYEMLLHMGCTVTKEPLHKLEILRAGDKTLPEMRELAGRVFATDPDELGIMRVDLTADIEGVPVDFFKRHTVVRLKQTRREHFHVDPGQTVSKAVAETIYAGVKPNQIRIYDKTGERRMQYQKYCARFARESARLPESAEVQATTFEEMYGHGMYDVITRVERQVAARDVEKMGLRTLRALRMHADTLDPFARMVFFQTQELEPRLDDGFTPEAWHCGMDLRERVKMFGLADVERQMRNEWGAKNYLRARKKFASFLRLTSNVVGIDAQGLRNAYATSTARQLLRAA
jgi:hypothetical protein